MDIKKRNRIRITSYNVCYTKLLRYIRSEQPKLYKNIAVITSYSIHYTKLYEEFIIKNEIKFYNIDALKIAEAAGLGNKISTVMQSIFFKLTGLIPEAEAMQLLKDAVKKTFIRKA